MIGTPQESIRSRQAWQHESSIPKTSIHFTVLQRNKIRHKWWLNGKNTFWLQNSKWMHSYSSILPPYTPHQLMVCS